MFLDLTSAVKKLWLFNVLSSPEMKISSKPFTVSRSQMTCFSCRIQGFTGIRVLLLRPWARVWLEMPSVKDGSAALAERFTETCSESEFLKEKRKAPLWTPISYPRPFPTTSSAATADWRQRQTPMASSYTRRDRSCDQHSILPAAQALCWSSVHAAWLSENS